MSGYKCMAEPCDQQVAWLITNLANGSTITACMEDLPPVLVGVVAEAVGVEMEGLYGVIEAHVNEVRAEEERKQVAELNARRQKVPRPGAKPRAPRKTAKPRTGGESSGVGKDATASGGAREAGEAASGQAG